MSINSMPTAISSKPSIKGADIFHDEKIKNTSKVYRKQITKYCSFDQTEKKLVLPNTKKIFHFIKKPFKSPCNRQPRNYLGRFRIWRTIWNLLLELINFRFFGEFPKPSNFCMRDQINTRWWNTILEGEKISAPQLRCRATLINSFIIGQLQLRKKRARRNVN